MGMALFCRSNKAFDINLQRLGNFKKRRIHKVGAAIFNLADLRPVDAAAVGQFLLAHALGLP